MYITEDLVIEVVSGIFIRSKRKKGENYADQISRGIKDIPHL